MRVKNENSCGDFPEILFELIFIKISFLVLIMQVKGIWWIIHEDFLFVGLFLVLWKMFLFRKIFWEDLQVEKLYFFGVNWGGKFVRIFAICKKIEWKLGKYWQIFSSNSQNFPRLINHFSCQQHKTPQISCESEVKWKCVEISFFTWKLPAKNFQFDFPNWFKIFRL